MRLGGVVGPLDGGLKVKEIEWDKGDRIVEKEKWWKEKLGA